MLQKKKLQIAVLGGDLRHAHLANTLLREGFNVAVLCMEKDVYLEKEVEQGENARAVLTKTDVAVLPLPATIDKININAPFSDKLLSIRDVLLDIPKGSLVLGGMLTPDIIAKGEQHGLVMLDYLEREELAVLNAVPTAEGAVAIAMRERASTIFGSRCLVTGYGRVAKVLARLLAAMGAGEVTVAARKPQDLAWARVNGCNGIHISKIKECAAKADILFNTVPAMILDEEILAVLPHNCLVIDLASKPGGVDFEMAKRLRVKTIWALSLPGKVAPITAGEILKETVINILTERGYIC